MNQYAQDLKSKLERVDDYVVHRETFRASNMFTSNSNNSTTSMFTMFKNTLWFIGIVVIGVSVVAFFTQTVLLVIDNAKQSAGEPDTVLATTVDGDPLQKMYVRADLGRAAFDTSPVVASEIASTTASTTATSSTTGGSFTDISVNAPIQSTDLGIPGVSRIGYDESVGERALTDNINKYSNSTLVLGGRDGEVGAKGKTIGGGDDVDVDNYDLLSNIAAPILSSKAYLVADLETGEVIVEKNADTIYPLASVSKLMTALVAREKMDMQTVAIVSRDAAGAYGAQGRLALGEKIRLRDLLFPLLMESSNDAAEVFADQFGHAKFIEEMNKKAISLDMFDTYYGDPSGLDPKNTSSPRDMLTLARHIYVNDPEIYDMTRVKQFSIKGHTWYNGNRLLPVSGFAGGKNGYIDQARQTTVSLFDVDLAKGGVRTVVIVILKSEAKDNDVTRLISYLKRSAVYQLD